VALRVTTELWVAALVRRVFGAGGFAAVERRGAAEAGAIMIVRRDRNGKVRLYVPAPQTSYDEAKPQERMFVEVTAADEEEVGRRLERELRFDPDIWVVEVETDEKVFAETVSVTTP
jgi:hypothetical protein